MGAASAIQVALKQKQKQKHTQKKKGEEKKVTDKARGEADAAEQDVCDHDWDLEDPFYHLQRLKSPKTKSSVTDAKPQQQKTGKKKKDTENARREADAAEQDRQKMGKKKDKEKAKGEPDAAEHDK